MNILDTLRGFVRRWYITIPGLVLAVGVAVAAWIVVQPSYERTATQLLLPGQGTLPENSSNPYLYLGGLTVVADVVVRTVGSEESLRDVLEGHPGAEVEISRDGTTGGPVLLITVTAPTDAEAAVLIDDLVDRTASTLADLQVSAAIAPADRVTVTPLAVDQEGIAQQRTRLLVVGGAAGAVAILTLLTASIVDGLAKRPGRRGEDDAGERADDGGEDPADERADSDAADLAEATADAEPSDVPVRAHADLGSTSFPAVHHRRIVDSDDAAPGPDAAPVRDVRDDPDALEALDAFDETDADAERDDASRAPVMPARPSVAGRKPPRKGRAGSSAGVHR